MPNRVLQKHTQETARHRLLHRRLLVAFGGLLLTLGLAASGYVVLGGQGEDMPKRITLGLWNALNAITTSGDFTDLTTSQKVWTGFSLILGGASLAYGMSSLTSIFVSASLWEAREQKKIMHKISGLSGHLIVCGYGRTGAAIAKLQSGPHTECVVIDHDPDAASAAAAAGFFAIVGDAAHDSTLRQASIETASTLIVSMGAHPEKIAVALMARGMNKSIFIASTSSTDAGQEWLGVAGCDLVLHPPDLIAREVARELDARKSARG